MVVFLGDQATIKKTVRNSRNVVTHSRKVGRPSVSVSSLYNRQLNTRNHYKHILLQVFEKFVEDDDDDGGDVG